ncbi:MAG TPA: hypothetical protein VFB90_03960 [Dehalococcoidia bacterium]|nr:hypothetical protein [Dehalococcoidia bacterium]
MGEPTGHRLLAIAILAQGLDDICPRTRPMSLHRQRLTGHLPQRAEEAWAWACSEEAAAACERAGVGLAMFRAEARERLARLGYEPARPLTRVA